MDRCARPLPGQLRDLVRAALDRQCLAIRRLRWMGQHTNHLFRCDTTAGERLVIRVCLPGGRSDAELDGELTWLAALARDTGLTIPAARFTTRVATPQLPDGGRCIGFDDASWGHYALDLAMAADDIPRELHPVLLRGYQTVCPLPPGYHEHQAALLSARHLYLAIWHLANGLPDEDHLSQLRAFTAH